MSVNECCRFCHKYLKKQGVLSHSTKIFEATGKAKTVYDRLVDLGLTLTKSPEKSIRSCRNCTSLLSRIERDLAVFRKWEDEEKPADSNEGVSASTAADKENRETPHSKTHRALKRSCPNPPNLTRICMSEQRSITETASYEESCPGITFHVSEFTFDEENNCSNEEGGEEENICSNEEGEEEDEIAVSETDWEKEDSDQLESDYSDQLETDGSDKRDLNLDSELHESVRHLCPECGVFVFTCKTHTCKDKIQPFSWMALNPITTADKSAEGHLRRPSSKDIDSDWNDRDPTSELTEDNKDEVNKRVRKRKRKVSQNPKSYYIAEKDFESDSDSNPAEEAKKRQVVKSEET